MSITEKIKKGVSLTPYTTLRVGGDAEYFVETDSPQMLREAAVWAKEQGLPIVCLGSGSNVLVSDAGVKGLVIHQRNAETEIKNASSDIFATVSAGAILDTFIECCVTEGWWGIENLSGIPGTVGATPIQNVGAYGVEVSDVIESVHVYDHLEDTFKVIDRAACVFGYRDSFFKTPAGKRYIVTAVTFRLSKEPHPRIAYKDLERFFKHNQSPTISEIRSAVCAIRSRKFPNWHEVGTAGSFFKNPIITRDAFRMLREKYVGIPGFEMGNDLIKIPFGYVLDKLFALKGVREDHVGLYEEQALVLVCDQHATAAEIKSFAQKIIDRARRELNIIVEREVTDLQ